MVAGCGARPEAEPTPDLALVYARALQTVLATAATPQSDNGLIPVTGGNLEAVTPSPDSVFVTATAAPALTPSPSLTATVTASVTATRTSTLTSTAPPTSTLTPTPRPSATKTRTPTRTRTATPAASPTKTRTPGPSVTAAPTPYPFQGSGNGSVRLPADAVGVLYITHGAGTRAFTVRGYSDKGELLDTLVDTTGTYDGRVPLNLQGMDRIARLEVQAEGAWGIRYYPLLTYDHWADTANIISGHGDDVWFARARPVQGLIIAGNADGGVFAVLVLGGEGYAIAVDTSDPYNGLFTMPPRVGTLYGLIVTASSDWQITIVE